MEFWKQKRRFLNKLIVFLIISMIYVFPVYSKNKHGKKFGDDCHNLDMLKVLGLYSVNNYSASKTNYDTLIIMFDSINDLIDQNITREFYNELKDEFQYFNYGEYGHRIIYHWAFDIDKNISDTQFQNAMAKLFNAKISAPYSSYPKYVSMYEYIYKEPLTDEIWQKEWIEFKTFIQKNQEKCNNKLTSIVRNTLGTNTADSRDIAALLYYIHLIGDHVEHTGELTGESVLEIDTIINNIDIHVKKLAKNNKGSYMLYKNAINSLPKAGEKEYAKNILETMESYIPQIIKYRFSNQFTTKNLQFVFEEGLLKVS